MTVTLYADETGIHDPLGQEPGSEVAGVAGYAAWREDWEKFCVEWQAVLDKYAVPRFHFKEYAAVKTWGPKNSEWPYAGWSPEKRAMFLNELARIARENTYFSVGGFVNVQEYRRIIPDWFWQGQSHPYSLCLKGFFEGVLRQLVKMKWSPERSKRVAFVFDRDQNPQWHDTVLEWYQVTRRKDIYGRMGTISFADGKELLPLQAADMLAYRARQITSKLVSSKFPVRKNSFDHELGLDNQNSHMSYANTNTLRQWAKGVERHKAEILKRWRQ
jgi:hypothetical protein